VTDPIALLREMVALRSVSGEEAAVRDLIASRIAARGLEPVIDGRNVWAMRGESGPGLLLNSHTDTVPPSPEWTRDPFRPEVEGGRLYGLGSNDAKGCLAAMIAAFLDVPDEAIRGGRLLLAATCDEEVWGEGLEKLLPKLPPLDAGVVGEPSHLEVATAQKGLVRAEVIARGRAGHASRPHLAENAISKAAAAVARVHAMPLAAREHPLLGAPTATVTMIQGGVKSNVVPPECRFTVDCRTVPNFANAEMAEALRGAAGECEVVVKSDRLRPIEGPRESPVVLAALAAAGKSAPIGFRGVTDFAHVGKAMPGVIFGPGTWDQSHAADESVAVEEVERASRIYAALVRGYFERVVATRGRA
jgi:acetylornithine deacetylase